MQPEDELLLEMIRQGDHSAFEQLVLRYQKKVYTIAYRFMGNSEDANDLAQETFLRIYRSIHSFRGESSLQTWIFQIAANVCRDELRRRQKVQWVHTDGGETETAREIADPSLRPEELVEGKEIRRNLHSLIQNLSDDYRVAIIMRDVMGFSYEEIAHSMGCSLGTVKSRICRGRQKLKDLVIRHHPEMLGDQREERGRKP